MKSALKMLSGLFALLSPLSHTFAQGTMTVTFDGPPVLRPGAGKVVSEYSEGGMFFRTLGSDGFVRTWSGDAHVPYNGTLAFIQATIGQSPLWFACNDWSPFSLISVDLAEYSTVVPDAMTVPFVGYRPDGSTVTTSFTTDGVIDGTGPLADFQTFYFGPEFSGLTRVEVPDFGSLDNLVLSIPEPGSGALLILAGGVFAWRLIRRKKARCGTFDGAHCLCPACNGTPRPRA